jgi:hypothetical protein
LPRVAVESNRRQTAQSAFHSAPYIEGRAHLYAMSIWQCESTNRTTVFSGCFTPTLISSAIDAVNMGYVGISRDCFPCQAPLSFA